VLDGSPEIPDSSPQTFTDLGQPSSPEHDHDDHEDDDEFRYAETEHIASISEVPSK
jgi:hypothetical protein